MSRRNATDRTAMTVREVVMLANFLTGASYLLTQPELDAMWGAFGGVISSAIWLASEERRNSPDYATKSEAALSTTTFFAVVRQAIFYSGVVVTGNACTLLTIALIGSISFYAKSLINESPSPALHQQNVSWSVVARDMGLSAVGTLAGSYLGLPNFMIYIAGVVAASLPRLIQSDPLSKGMAITPFAFLAIKNAATSQGFLSPLNASLFAFAPCALGGLALFQYTQDQAANAPSADAQPVSRARAQSVAGR